MRRKITYTVNPPAEGKHIAYCREDRAWVTFWNAERVGEYNTPEEARAGLDSYVYEMLRRQPAAA